MTNLSVKTIRRVFDQRDGVDRRTLQDVFNALGSALHADDFVAVRHLDRLRAARRPLLPVPSTSFLGRDADVEQVKSLLQEARLLTLTGPGGIGKTRLAIKAAGDLSPQFRGHVWFVDLSAHSRVAHLDEALLNAIGIPGAPEASARRLLIDFFNRQATLLVLDNCEHLVCQAADVVRELLANVAAISVVVTTRQVLGLDGEVELQVRPFPIPGAHLTPEALAQYDVVRLFIARAALGNPGFGLNAQNARDIAEICRRLEGIPFAVELAAAQIKMLSPPELLKRLGDRLGMLRSVHRITARHRTMEESLEWSYALLSDPEQTLCNRLSLFMGGWTLEAAGALAQDELQGDRLVDGLAQLVNKSLVLVDFQGTSQRYRFLETTRQFAYDMLKHSGDFDACFARYARYFLDLARDARSAYDSGANAESVTFLAAEIENIRNVLEWSLLSNGDLELGCRLSSLLTPFWLESDQGREGIRWLTLARDRCEVSDSRPSLSYGLGLLNAYGHALDHAVSDIRRSVDEWSFAGDAVGAATALHTLGVLRRLAGSDDDAAACLRAAVEVHRTVGNRRAVGAGLLNLALHHASYPDDENRRTALDLFAQSLDYLHEADPPARLAGSDREGHGPLGTIGWDVESDLVLDKQLLSVLSAFPGFGIRQCVRVAALETASGMHRSARARCIDAVERSLAIGSGVILDVLDDVADVLQDAGLDDLVTEVRAAQNEVRLGSPLRPAVSPIVHLIQKANLAG